MNTWLDTFDGGFDYRYLTDTPVRQLHTLCPDYYMIYILCKGQVSVSCRNQSRNLIPGSVVFISPDTPVSINILDYDIPYERFIIRLSPSYYDSLCEISSIYGYIGRTSEGDGSCIYTLSSYDLRYIQNLIINLSISEHTTFLSSDEQRCLSFRQLLLSLNEIICSSAKSSSNSLDDSIMRDVLLYIDSNLDKDLSIDSLSGAFLISNSYLAHKFKDVFGLPMHQYITKKRLINIQAALMRGTDISRNYSDFGFKDYSVLYRAFIREFGMSPKEYKRYYTENS